MNCNYIGAGNLANQYVPSATARTEKSRLELIVRCVIHQQECTVVTNTLDIRAMAPTLLSSVVGAMRMLTTPIHQILWHAGYRELTVSLTAR